MLGTVHRGLVLRAARRPSYAVALALIVVAAAASAGLAEAARVQVIGEVDRNWRGAYDILVRPVGGRLDVEKTRGLIEPNFLGYNGRGGISLAQLDAIRGIPGVELAAPVSIVGRMANVQTFPIVHLSELPDRPSLFRLDLTVSASDGIRAVIVNRQTAYAVLGPADLNKPATPFRTDGRSFSWGAEGVDIELSAMPPVTSVLMAVDPAAERALLGPSASFMAPLIEEQPDKAGRSVADFDLGRIPPEYELESFVIGSLRELGNDAAGSRPVVPIVVSDRLYVPVSARLQIEKLGDDLGTYPADDAWPPMLTAAENGELASTEVGSSELELSSRLAPFQAAEVTLLWPGSTPPSGSQFGRQVVPDFKASLETRPGYVDHAQRSGSTNPTFEIHRVGVTGGSEAGPPGDGGSAAQEATREATYRVLEVITLGVADGFVPTSPDDRPFHFAPVGKFDFGSIEIPRNPLNYVPLGAYDPPRTTLVAGSAGTPTSPVEVSPTLNSSGLVSVPPLAITDLTSAVTLRGPAPIDAVRIRVRGIADYSPASQRRVEEVGSAVAAMGLDVDLVAGSSPQAIELFVPGYFVESDSDLGYVRQDWTTLGVAERITTSLESINAMIIGLALAATAILLTTLAQVDIASRRREALILKSIGWTRIRLIAWFMAQPLAGTVVVLGAAATAWIVSRGSAVGLLAAAALAGLIGVVGLVSALFTVNASSGKAGFSAAHLLPSRAARLMPASGTWGLVMRFALSSSIRLAMVSATVACGAAALVLAGLLVASAGDAAGPTALADVVLRGNRPFQLGILGGTTGASLLAATVALRAASSSLEPSVLVAGGWVHRDVQRVRLGFYGLVGAVGAVLAAAVVWVGASLTDAEAIVSPMVAAGLVAMAIPVLLSLMPWRDANVGLR